MSDTRTQHSRNSNPWKWAFLILITLLFVGVIGGGMWVYSQLQPVHIGEENTQEIEHEDSNFLFEISSSTEQVERLVNVYLEEEIGDDFVGYQFVLNEEAELHGELVVFGFTVNFTLTMSPYVTENGNLQLRGETISIGRFDIPMSMVFGLIADQFVFPDWVAVDSDEQMIHVNLNEFYLENGAQLSIDRLDLETNEVIVHIHLPEESIR